MKILLIYPSLSKKSEKKLRFSYYDFLYKILKFSTPLNFIVLAALTSDKHEVEIIDNRYQKLSYNIDHDLIGISCMTHESLKAYQMADEFRRRGKTVVLGGWHPSALPEEAKQHADAVVIGEAEETWPQLLQDLENNKLKPFYYQKRPVDPKIIPSRSKIKNKYNSNTIQATRGCIHNCEFCCMTQSKYQGQFRKRAIDDVIEEINSMPDKMIAFYDNSLTIDRSYSKELFKRVKDLNKKFICFGNVTVAKDEELIGILSEAGCIGWSVGFESISQNNLISIKKNVNKADEYEGVIKKLHDYNISVFGSFIFGFDGDTKNSFTETLNTVNNINLDAAGFNILTPFPGTPLYEKMNKQDRLLIDDWSKYDTLHVVFQPKNMTPDELYNGTKRVMEEFNSPYNTIKRGIKSLKLGYLQTIYSYSRNVDAKLVFKHGLP